MSARTWATATFAVGLTLTAASSFAAYLVDTGPMVQGGYGGANVFASDPPTAPYGPQQFLAGRFSLSERSDVFSVEGWMASAQDGTLSAVIYSDTNNLPSSELFAGQFAVDRLTWQFGVAAGWFGASSLAWVLDPGTYWLAFEVRPGDSLFGLLPNEGGVTMQAAAPFPLAIYAADNGSGWQSGPSAWGMRIAGQAAPIPVPEPATLALLGLGLAGLLAIRRRTTEVQR